MTTARFEEQERTIFGALAGSGGKVVTVDRGAWDLYPGERARIGAAATSPVEVRLRDNRVQCCAPLPVGLNGDFEGYALATPALPGRCKVILDPADMTPRLREEILSVEGVDLAGACGSAIANLASAGDLLRPSTAHPVSDATACGTRAVPAGIAETLAEVSQASGWIYTEHGDGDDREIVLAASHGGRHATVYAWGEHGVRVSVELSRLRGLPGTSRRAAAALALTANGLMWLVRAGFAGLDEAAAGRGDTHPFLETRFTQPPPAAALGFALSTFSAAIDLFDLEFSVMADVSLARHYLEARGLEEGTGVVEAIAS